MSDSITGLQTLVRQLIEWLECYGQHNHECPSVYSVTDLGEQDHSVCKCNWIDVLQTIREQAKVYDASDPIKDMDRFVYGAAYWQERFYESQRTIATILHADVYKAEPTTFKTGDNDDQA